MTVPVPTRSRWLDFLPVISLAVVLAGIVWAGGVSNAQLKENTRRISQLEGDARSDAKARTEMLQQLDLRLARIEVKLEMMLPEKEKQQ
jgi:outer membrane murein-binding lipoprotein Lpp